MYYTYPTYLEGALEVDLLHQVPVLVAHVGEALVPQNAGVVDDDVHAAKDLDGGLHDAVAGVHHRVVVGRSAAAPRRGIGHTGSTMYRIQLWLNLGLNAETVFEEVRFLRNMHRPLTYSSPYAHSTK